MSKTRTIRISNPTLTTTAGGRRVSADVDGTSVWFESPDLALAASPEAFVSAFLLPSIAHRARLVSDPALDSRWLEGSREIVQIFHEWWRYPALAPDAAAATPGPEIADRGRALFFSGGVDSFHSLLCCGEQVDLLVFVHGFDIPLDDSIRADSAFASVRSIAAEVGLRCGLVRTNVREHPLFRPLPWERTHGGALAAVGHVLMAEAHEVLISSSISTTSFEAWGSHSRTDKLFSSSRLQLRQVAEAARRMHKVQAVALQQLPRKHLRVCWVNSTATGNCSRCRKCVITRLIIAEAGTLDEFPVFEGSATLARDIGAITSDPHLQTFAEMSSSPRLEPAIRAATRALYERSVRRYSFLGRARRALLDQWREWTKPKRR